MRVLVTGAAGFIGSHLCEFLLGRGCDVVGMDNFITGSPDNLAEFRDARGFALVQHDVTQHIDVEGPLDWGHVNPIGPRGVYDEAKRFAEAMTMAYHRVHRVDTRIARVFNTFGPKMRLNDGRAIPAFMTQALRGEPLTVFGDGSQTRSFQYITDLIDGVWRLMQAAVNEPVNLGNPQEMTLLELAKRILRLTGSRSEIVFRPLPVDDPKVRQPDITRARALLGWEPRVDTDEGLKLTLEWFIGALQRRSDGK